MSTLSVIVITKNEEKNIRQCLESIRWADEIIVVDAGSTDSTVELVKAYTNKIYVKPWDGFGPAKNFALSVATSDWILWLDADERVTLELAQEVKQTIHSNHSQTAYTIPRKAFFLGRWIKHCGWYPGRVVRLFHRQNGKFTEEKVHEQLIIEGTIGNLQSDLLHYTDPNLMHYFDKFNRYTSLAADELAHQHTGFHFAQLIFGPFWIFVKMYIIRLGFLDGIQGFILCVLSSCYVFTKYAKLWERQHQFVKR